MSRARSAFSALATTLSMLLYRSEFRSYIPVRRHVRLPPVSTAPDPTPRKAVPRLASRPPVPRFLDYALASFPVTTCPVQRNALCPCAQGGRGQARRANTFEVRSSI